MAGKQKSGDKDKKPSKASKTKNNPRSESHNSDTRQGYQGPIVGGG